MRPAILIAIEKSYLLILIKILELLWRQSALSKQLQISFEIYSWLHFYRHRLSCFRCYAQTTKETVLGASFVSLSGSLKKFRALHR